MGNDTNPPEPERMSDEDLAFQVVFAKSTCLYDDDKGHGLLQFYMPGTVVSLARALLEYERRLAEANAKIERLREIVKENLLETVYQGCSHHDKDGPCCDGDELCSDGLSTYAAALLELIEMGVMEASRPGSGRVMGAVSKNTGGRPWLRN